MATNSNFKFPGEYKRWLASTPPEMRSITKKLLIEAYASYDRVKNRKFSDPASSQGGRRNQSKDDSQE